MLEKVISGLQTGADIAGVSTAAKFGIKTGGTMPKGYLTQLGPKPDWARKYGAVEHSSPKYPPRTEKNVVDSDGTIRFASNFESSGEKCTMGFIKKHDKHWIDVDIMNPRPVQEVIDWIKEKNIRVLNVAGNSEKTCSGITEEVENYLSELFVALGFKC